jgi:hypothetical protein
MRTAVSLRDQAKPIANFAQPRARNETGGAA